MVRERQGEKEGRTAEDTKGGKGGRFYCGREEERKGERDNQEGE